MSSPTPIYNTKRSEDLQNLNSILLGLAIDERLRVKAVKEVTLTKSQNSYTATAQVTVPFDGYPAVIGGIKLVGSNDWYQLPYMDIVGAATPTMKEFIRIHSISFQGGIATITVKLDCNSTDYANTLTRTVKLIILKDKFNN
jgi:hypothetical protein